MCGHDSDATLLELTGLFSLPRRQASSSPWSSDRRPQLPELAMYVT